MIDILEAADRAKGSELLPKIMLGGYRADNLIAMMAQRIRSLDAALKTQEALGVRKAAGSKPWSAGNGWQERGEVGGLWPLSGTANYTVAPLDED